MSTSGETRVMDRDDALEDLRGRSNELVTIHDEDGEKTQCPAYALQAGLRCSGQPFVYYVLDGEAHICTGFQSEAEAEAKREEIDQPRQLRAHSDLAGLAADQRHVAVDGGGRISAQEALRIFEEDPRRHRLVITVQMS